VEAPATMPVAAQQPQTQIDVDRISEQVIRRIERRARIERERRGML
jgi:hypothetical protein